MLPLSLSTVGKSYPSGSKESKLEFALKIDGADMCAPAPEALMDLRSTNVV